MRAPSAAVIVLALCQALTMTAVGVVIISSGLIGDALAPGKALATLPYTAMVAGIAIGTFPAAYLIDRLGRRNAFVVASFAGAAGGAACSLAIYRADFAMFCLGLFLIGASSAFASFYRFAAADMAPEQGKSAAISLVVLGTLPAAFLAPAIIAWSAALASPDPYIAAYAAIVALCGASAVLLAGANIAPRAQDAPARAADAKGLLLLPAFVLGTACCAVGYAVMNLLMVSSPLAMVLHGHTVHEAALAIQWHLVAMYLPSTFSAPLIRRFGANKVIFAGAVLMLSSALVVMGAPGFASFVAGLALAGTGWNFMYVAGSTLVASLSSPGARATVQAASNFIVFLSMTVSSLLAGSVLHYLGWRGIGTAAMLLISLFAALALALSLKRAAASRSGMTYR